VRRALLLYGALVLQSTPESWARAEFGGAALGDRRRTSRLVTFAQQLSSDARASIPTATRTWADARAAYRLMANKAVTQSAILAPHSAATAVRCRSVPRLVVVQDTTHCSFSGRIGREGLGPVDTTGGTDGFMCHTALVTHLETGEPLGVAAQRVWARSQTAHSPQETIHARRARARESDKWLEVAEQVAQVLRDCPAEIVQVFDREGDYFDALECLERLNHNFVIRASRDRLLWADDDEPDYVAEAAATGRVVGSYTFVVPARPKRPERVALIDVRVASVFVEPPLSRNRKGKPQQVNLVYACERNPPKGAHRVCWLLLTRLPQNTLAEAQAVIQIYLRRWIIEDFHLAVKTGCALERRELRSFHSLTNFLAVCTPVAVEMLRLRHFVRTAPEVAASKVLSANRIETLRLLDERVPEEPTIRKALHAIAGLGGFLQRKSDGEPGFRRLWIGWTKLLAAERVYTAVTQKERPKRR
jgi:hypothetical protein